MAGVLYSVALPIGNPKDITLRAKEILERVSWIACEDTRKFQEIAQRIPISYRGKLFSYYAPKEREKAPFLLSLLERGEEVALVSDAGSPGISDPGRILIEECWKRQIPVVPVPGPSSLCALLMVSPFPNEPFLFLGFLPRKKGKRRRVFQEYQNFGGVIGFMESVHRVEEVLKELEGFFPRAKIFIGREMTKIYEEYFYGSLKEAILWLEKRKKGEFLLFLWNQKKELSSLEDSSMNNRGTIRRDI